ncbi:fibroblast growth factor 6 [Spea bombifrons]|uniref:fibroblast growth factor 6 n=1 Tax=Spea bombifrons TaxID=233779 RepID=UPI002349B11C|nr:fibroblast growth factor 6 [Spea bombifrons]
MVVAQRPLITMSHGARIHWTLSTFVVLGFLAEIVLSYPLPSRANGTLLERRWESILTRSIGMTSDKSDIKWRSDYLLGIKRQRRLYCNIGIGFHLQVLPDGSINGIHSETQYSLIEISTVERGVISLFGVKSRLFVAMNNKGRIYASPTFQDECKFKEILLSNNYNAYESQMYQAAFLGLSKHGRIKRGTKISPAMTVTHFLPRM